MKAKCKFVMADQTSPATAVPSEGAASPSIPQNNSTSSFRIPIATGSKTGRLKNPPVRWKVKIQHMSSALTELPPLADDTLGAAI